MSTARLRFFGLLSGALLTLPVVAACTDNVQPGTANESAPSGRALTVQATDDACTVSAPAAPSGNLTFSVTNGGSKVTEFYLLGADGLRIVGEVENIGPGLSRELVVVAPPGSYYTACKPGMVGDGIRSVFAVTDSGEDLTPKGDDKALVDQANRNYQAYVKDQTEQLVTKTDEFAALYVGAKDDEARALYPVARVHWERIETVAESFGDLDPKMDAREADLEPGRSGPAGTRSRRTCGRSGLRTTPRSPRRSARPSRRIWWPTPTPCTSGSGSSATPPIRSPTAPRACSTRSRPGR